jgi:hypothetical protein
MLICVHLHFKETRCIKLGTHVYMQSLGFNQTHLMFHNNVVDFGFKLQLGGGVQAPLVNGSLYRY